MYGGPIQAGHAFQIHQPHAALLSAGNQAQQRQGSAYRLRAGCAFIF
jgi:hypothetical protein